MSTDTFEVIGGRPLSGVLHPQGAKNEALQVISAVLLTDEPVTIANVPDILDVNKLIDLLRGLGVTVEQREPGAWRFCAGTVDVDYLRSDAFLKDAQRLRGSVMLIGPLLARFGRASLPKPGGDKIGRRRLDTHFLGFQMLGAEFKYDDEKDIYYVQQPDGGLHGVYLHMDEISVTGTANVLMAAVLTPGRTTIYNAACEPYVQQLCRLLQAMGARIEGIGSNMLHIDGVERLGGAEHRCLPDMIEVGSFIGLAAMTQSDITIKNAGIGHLGIIPRTFERLGIRIDQQGDDLHVPAQEHYEIHTFIDGSILTLYDAPWPGFTPDLLSIVLVVATQARGNVLIHQKMFESRLFFVDKLIDMGAQIILCDPHRANVMGLDRRYPLRGIEMSSPDIRAGVALLIAALSAKGKSLIHNVHQIDRGYQFIDERLRGIGADVRRV
ncbi:MAG: UDP-N-acetylglucosamine 1-carboxyvinyltransferase [Saprospiraceae bacterium]|nr:UDP-N-acetylglucosamine 1-carboxyvinyltransferase [Saprospiraceae bacterium]